jgi:hypothetical protein
LVIGPALLDGGGDTAPGDPTDVRDVLQLRRTALEAAQSAAEHPATALPPVIVLCAGTGDDDRAEFLARQGALPIDRIRGVETGGCPHTAIREDASMNLEAVEEMAARFPDVQAKLLSAGALDRSLSAF